MHLAKKKKKKKKLILKILAIFVETVPSSLLISVDFFVGH